MTVPSMRPGTLDLIQEIDRLWEPVYPYLARHVDGLYGRQDGDIVEIGPFCGVLFALLKQGIGSSFRIAAFPFGMGDFFRQEARNGTIEDKVGIIDTDPSLSGVGKDRFDLAIFRGAFFFPSLFRVHFSEIYRILRPQGIAIMGGGFGKFTPPSVIQDIGKRSRTLNLEIGRVEVNEDQLRREIEGSLIQGSFEITSEGGLWVVMRK